MWDWTKERRSRARLSLPWWGQSCGLKGELRRCLHKALRDSVVDGSLFYFFCAANVLINNHLSPSKSVSYVYVFIQ